VPPAGPAAQNVQMASTPDSARKSELLAAAYDYALANGLAEEEPHHSYGADLIGQVHELDLHARPAVRAAG
jgi:hypothetical protein